jgi:predicted ribosome quality control (RQC) complex YloA/Tae2 family protein
VHNNYYFLRKFSAALSGKLTGAVISEVYTQTKEELILRFEIGRQSVYLRAPLLPAFSCLSVWQKFDRARRNSVDLFPRLVGEKVNSIRQFENERSFVLNLSNDVDLLFKMHGNRSNIILFENQIVSDLFKKSLPADKGILLQNLDRAIDWSFDNFVKNESVISKIYFTFGKVVWNYLTSRGFHNKSTIEKWELINEVRVQLDSNKYFLINSAGVPVLSLIPFDTIIRELNDPILAANEFFNAFNYEVGFNTDKQRLTATLKSKLTSSKNYITKTSAKLGELEADNNYRLWADLIMANLHGIDSTTGKAVVQNFYNADKAIEIKLKKDLSPQRNAEVFYQKAKNQQIELQFLRKAITEKENDIVRTSQLLQRVEQSEDAKEIKQIKKEIETAVSPAETKALPYHEFEFRGYRILVGRSAQANDELTLKLSYKEDLWLHAKDVSGSHVIIKHQAGKKFPKDVIERAAELAAYNSKRKTDTLCPVIFTPKKYVRKRKGDPPGAVVVEREEVILVKPKL